MHKYLLKATALSSATLLLLCGCVTSADKDQDTVTCKLQPPEGPVACTMQYDPVCGCDGVSYGNACMARGAGIPHSTPGTCEGNPNN